MLEELQKSHGRIGSPRLWIIASRKVGGEPSCGCKARSGTQQDLAATNAPPPEAQPSPQRSTEPTVDIRAAKSKPSIIVQPAGEASPAPAQKEAAAPAPAASGSG